MKAIQASLKARGLNYWRSVEAARRRVKDGEVYLIRRHGAFFRPEGHGYTTRLAGAGVYTAEQARSYLDVEGLSVIPLRSLRDRIEGEADQAQAEADALRQLLCLAKAKPRRPTPQPTERRTDRG